MALAQREKAGFEVMWMPVLEPQMALEGSIGFRMIRNSPEP